MIDQPENELKPLTEDEGFIVRYLTKFAQGRASAVPVENLVGATFGDHPGDPFRHDAQPPYRTREREVRRIVKHLVEVHGFPIASCKDGFFIPETSEEVERACRQLHRAAMSHLVRESRLRKKSLPELLGQMALEVGKT